MLATGTRHEESVQCGDAIVDIAIGYQVNPSIWHINLYYCSSVVADGFQSLAQINV
jgi:hypothetical protein